MSNARIPDELLDQLMALIPEHDREAPVQFFVDNSDGYVNFMALESGKLTVYPMNWDTAVFISFLLYQKAAMDIMKANDTTWEAAATRAGEYWLSLIERGKSLADTEEVG